MTVPLQHLVTKRGGLAGRRRTRTRRSVRLWAEVLPGRKRHIFGSSAHRLAGLVLDTRIRALRHREGQRRQHRLGEGPAEGAPRSGR